MFVQLFACRTRCLAQSTACSACPEANDCPWAQLECCKVEWSNKHPGIDREHVRNPTLLKRACRECRLLAETRGSGSHNVPLRLAQHVLRCRAWHPNASKRQRVLLSHSAQIVKFAADEIAQLDLRCIVHTEPAAPRVQMITKHASRLQQLTR